MIDKNERKFVVMMLPFCADIAEGRQVDVRSVMTMQNVFLYAITGDEMFVENIRSGYSEELVSSKSSFLRSLTNIHGDPKCTGQDAEFLRRLPKPMAVAVLWWSSLKSLFKEKYPEHFGGNHAP